MTDEEKTIVKEMNRTILELTYLKGLHEAVLKKRVENWGKEMATANESSAFQEFRKRIDEARGAGDFAEADRLREAIADLGWEVRDVPGGFELVRR